jgi:DNA polymerase I
MTLRRFHNIWLIDFEFNQPDGERPEPICMVALEVYSGATIRLGPDELRRHSRAPFPTGPDSLVVAYFASAEMNCFRALGWPLPANLLDLYAEFANNTNGKPLSSGRKLLGALVYYGLSGISYAEKQAMQDLACRGGPFTAGEMRHLLDYCESDVRALQALLPAMEPFDLPYALLRGSYVKAVSAMETTGIPIDVDTLLRLRLNWDNIKEKLVDQVGHDYLVLDSGGAIKYPIYDGSAFRRDRFGEYLDQNNIPWPTLPSGTLNLDDDTFRQMAKIHPKISQLRELRHALSQLRLNDLAVGKDDRNRCLLSPFQSRTGRNQPSTSKFIFGSSVWLRGLIQPMPGWAVAYLDWSGQEYGIAAALSEDPAMMADYQSGDAYLMFAKHLGMVPLDATKKTHPDIREAFKVALGLGAMYGAGANTIGTMIGKPPAFADYLLRQHRQKYARFWAWRDAAVDYAMMHNRLWTVFGWTVHVEAGANPRSISNFPMQANGAEMMRLATILVTEAGIRLCAPIHDALLIEAPADSIDDAIEETRRLMAQASRTVLGGFELRTGVEKVIYPDRYRDDKRGGPMWDRVMSLLPSS